MREINHLPRTRGAALFTAGGLFVATLGYLTDAVCARADSMLGATASQRTRQAQLVAQAYRQGFQAGAAQRAKGGPREQ